MDYLGGALCFSIAVLTVFSPGILLIVGWKDLRAGRYEKADTRATLAGMSSVWLFGLLGLLSVLMAAKNDEPWAFAILALPGSSWYLSRVLHRSIQRRRESAREERRVLRRENRGGEAP